MSVAAPPPKAPSPFRRDYWDSVAESLYLKRIVEFVGGNLTLVGVLLYAYVSIVGILYCEALYYWVGINPLHFFDASDFLLAGLRHPFALIAPAPVRVTAPCASRRSTPARRAGSRTPCGAR